MSIFEADELHSPVLEIVITRISERKGVLSEWNYTTQDESGKGHYSTAPTQREHEAEVLKLRLPADDYDLVCILEAILGCGK